MKYRRLYTTSPDRRSDSGMEEHVQRYEGHMGNRSIMWDGIVAERG